MTKLRKLKEQRNMTTKELAEQVGVTTQMLYFMENGKRKGSVETNIKLAKVLGVSLDELIEKEGVNNGI